MRISDGQVSRFIRGLAACLIVGMLLSGLSGCERGGGRPRANRVPGSAVDPDELVGRWKLRYVQIPVEIDFVLLDITHKDKKFSVKLAAVEEHPAQPKLKSADIKDDGQVQLEIDVGGLAWNYQGRLDGENVWGTLLMPQFQMTAAKLERTELEKIDFQKQSQEPERISTLADLMAAENAADKFVALYEFLKKKESNRSPLLIEGYAALGNFLKSEKYSLEKVKEFITEYRAAIEVWGPRMAPRVDLEVGKALARQQMYPELAKELLTTAEKQITADYPFDWKVQLAEAWVTLGEHERGLKLLKPLQEIDETNPQIRLIYARAREQAKDVDEALKVYSGLAMLPQFERGLVSRGASPDLVLPSEAAARLWKQKNGDTKGLDEYLKTAYDEQMKLFVPERKSASAEAKGQVVLLELFTGSACNPCVPADIACEALRQAFSPQELVVIKYHEHAPLPDPLANEGVMQRFEFYGGQGTPMLLFNGQIVDNVGGPVGAASNLISRVKFGIEEELKKKESPIELKVSATRTGDDIEIKASVNGIKTTDNDPRLILVLLENEIAFQAPNGIRIHNCIARGFAGGSLGTKLKPGEIDHTQTISLTKLKTELAAHLKQFEDQAGKQFPAKPMELAKLQVAAIVQNQITKTYMQAALVDVADAKP